MLDDALLSFGDDQGHTDSGGQAVENVRTQGSVSRQEITELLSRDSRLGGEVRDQPPAAFTPKEFRHIAQGCERSELPWVG